MSILVSKAQQRDNLAALVTAKLHSLVVILLKTNLSPDPETAIADILAAEADYDSYDQLASQAVTQIEDGAGVCKLVTGNLVWTVSTVQTTSNTIYGYAVISAGSVPELFWFEMFSEGFGMANPGDSISFVAKYELNSPTGDYQETE